MTNINNFYATILNINNVDRMELISSIVKEEKEIVLKENDSLDGFCKLLASMIEKRLNESGIRTFWIDLNEFVNVDHTILISEYKVEDEMKRVLIDPTFSQFVKKENHKLNYLVEWPSEKIKDKGIVTKLVEDGLVLIDNRLFNDYLDGFNSEHKTIDLDEYLISLRLEEFSPVKLV